MCITNTDLHDSDILWAKQTPLWSILFRIAYTLASATAVKHTREESERLTPQILKGRNKGCRPLHYSHPPSISAASSIPFTVH